MRVEVYAHGLIAEVLHFKQIEVELPEGTTVIELVRQLADRAGPRAQSLLLSPDHRTVRVETMINGEAVAPDTLLSKDTSLKLVLRQH